MQRLDGKVALVTGAGQGIGRGIALALAAEGARVAVAGRTLKKVREVAREITDRGGKAVAVKCDVTSATDVRKAVDATVAELGGLDVLVNNAQEFHFGPLLDLDVKGFEAGWRSGVLGTIHGMQAAHPHLVDGGVIINVGSNAASDPAPQGAGGYAAAKAAIATLSRVAAVEWAGDGIRVLTLVPFARTPAVAAQLDAYPEVEEHILSGVPMGRWGDAETDIGRAVVFAASEDAAFMTGTSLVVDGGSTHLR